MNYMKKVAEMLGVEIGERFYIDDYRSIEYELTENGMVLIGFPGQKVLMYTALHQLLTGAVKIIKKEVQE